MPRRRCNPNDVFVFVDIEGDEYTVKGAPTLDRAMTAARDRGARGDLKLVKAEGKNLMELFKQPRK